MGTNYYWTGAKCACCGHRPTIHIGKQSAGWVFMLHVDPEHVISNLNDWRRRFAIPGSIIEDEYDHELSAGEMLAHITNLPPYPRGWSSLLGDEAAFHDENESERGPRGLLRARIDGRRCLAHGPEEQTYSLHAGEFF